jgi:predicted RNase H-like HicB family nuclease
MDMARQFDVVIERDEEGMYVASVPQLPGCHTDAASLDELMVEIREAIELCLEAQGQEPNNLEFVGIQRVTIAASARSRAPRERNLFGLWNAPGSWWTVFEGATTFCVIPTAGQRSFLFATAH